jgi:hypothetical protein
LISLFPDRSHHLSIKDVSESRNKAFFPDSSLGEKFSLSLRHQQAAVTEEGEKLLANIHCPS